MNWTKLLQDNSKHKIELSYSPDGWYLKLFDPKPSKFNPYGSFRTALIDRGDLTDEVMTKRLETLIAREK